MLTHNMADVGGSFLRAHSLGRALARRRHEVILLVSRALPGLKAIMQQREGLVMLQPPDILPERVRHGGLSPVDILWRSAVVARMEVDIVHAFDHRPAVSIPALLNRRLRGTAIISDWADLWGLEGIAGLRGPALRSTLGALDGWAEGMLRRRVDGVTVAGSSLAARAGKLGAPPDRILTLPPGANTDLINAMDKKSARVQLRLPVGARIVVHAGLADYDEWLLGQTLLEVLRRDQELTVLTTGLAPAGLERALAGGKDRSRWIHFGFVPYDELGTILGAADVLLLPYGDREINRSRYPNKLGDYLAAGRPIVSNRTGDVGPLIETEGVGLLANENPGHMAEAVLSLMKEPQVQATMGDNARRLAEGPFAWETLARQVEEFYTRILSKSGGRREQT